MASRTRGLDARSGIQFFTTSSTGDATRFWKYLADSIDNGTVLDRHQMEQEV